MRIEAAPKEGGHPEQREGASHNHMEMFRFYQHGIYDFADIPMEE